MPLDALAPPGVAEGRVGPNAIIQTAVALQRQVGATSMRDVFSAAGIAGALEVPPGAMVKEGHVLALFQAIRAALEPDWADAVLREAGRLTGQYVLDHRIPRPVQRVLKSLPAGLAGPLLTRAIAQNAWTFCGSGQFVWRAWPRLEVAIIDNPIATPGCPWHAAVFERLYGALVSPRVSVRHNRTHGREGSVEDRFVIAIA